MNTGKGQWVMAGALVGMLAVALAPLPATLFDLLIGMSLCISALTFLVAFYVEKPTDFSSFPSLLLFNTLFRLALNVASTRLILQLLEYRGMMIGVAGIADLLGVHPLCRIDLLVHEGLDPLLILAAPIGQLEVHRCPTFAARLISFPFVLWCA